MVECGPRKPLPPLTIEEVRGLVTMHEITYQSVAKVRKLESESGVTDLNTLYRMHVKRPHTFETQKTRHLTYDAKRGRTTFQQGHVEKLHNLHWSWALS